MSNDSPLENGKPPNIRKLINDLQAAASGGREVIEAKILDAQLAMLRSWQSARLARTYADLLADPRYAPAGQFFLTDIYAPRDFSQRDHDIQRFHDILSRFLPQAALKLLIDSIAINKLSYELDHKLLEIMTGQLGVTDTITPEAYAEGYRLCDNYAIRVHQIEQTASIIREVGDLAHLAVTGPVLWAAKKPATKTGWTELYNFLEHGHAAFKAMKDVDFFANTLHDRELSILNRIYTNAANPFDPEPVGLPPQS